MKRRKLTIIAISLLSALTVSATTVATYAWFKYGNEITFGGNSDDVPIKAGANSSYYGGGDGSETNPFIISKPIHLYNLAWLQYIGTYNTPTIQQKYFKVTDDIDMNEITLPPIGTEQYPFLSNFDGNNKTISNLTITNADPKTSDEYGVMKPDNTVLADTTQTKIVGFFGVVGKLPEQEITYSSSILELKNITLDNISVASKTSETLIGLAAGYVDGTMSGVKVGKSTVSVNGAQPITSITSNLSDYSLVGFTSSTSTVSDFTKKISESFHETESGGNVGGFGASVNFKDYSDWIWESHVNKAYDTGTGNRDIGFMVYNGISSSYSKRYNDITSSTYQLAMESPTYPANPNYEISFNRLTTSASYNYYGANLYIASFDINYLDNDAIVGQFTETTSDKSSTQTYDFTGTNIGGDKSYNSVHQINFGSSRPIWAPATVYLYGSYSASEVKVYTNSNLSTELAYNGKKTTFYFRDNAVYHLENDNYIPLTFDEEKSQADEKNTGYIIGVNLANDTTNYSAGTPRIASYASSYLDSSISDGVISNVKTYDNGEWKTIAETKENGSVIDTTNVSFMSGKYIKARNSVGSIIEGSSRIHGIHFDVSDSNVYSEGYYRGAIYQDAYIEKNMLLKSYKGMPKLTRMPKGCIDFELEDAGYITFFAGMYNSTSSVTDLNFFSLFYVDRENPTSYTLKEIKKIYKSSTWSERNPDYVYWYDEQAEPNNHGDLVFDIEATLWPARSKDNSLYYFEIPVNEGEYAMGAVNRSHTGGTKYQGAYMMYLDIGSNGKSAGDTEIDAYFVETTSSSDACPAGVDFNITSLASVGGNTVCIRLTYNSSSLTGSISFIPNASTVSADAKISGAQCCYDSGGVLDASSSTQTIADVTGTGGGGNRIIYASITTSTGEEWELRYQEILNGSGNITSTTYLSVIKDDDDVTSDVNSSTLSVPEIFTDNISDIKLEAIAVQLAYRSNDFSITEIEYSGTRVSLTIPTAELGSTSLTVTYPSTNYNSLYINGNAYPVS